jgi:hypothetical protein
LLPVSVKALLEFGGFEHDSLPAFDGFCPNTGLVIGPDGHFYGATINGGRYNTPTNSWGGTEFQLF